MIPFKPAEDLLSLIAPAAALLILLAVAAAAAWWYAKRHGGVLLATSRARRMRVLERLPLSRHAALLLVECDGRTLLIGQSGDRVSLIEGAAPRAEHGA